jgi:hypothetical protein
MPTSGKDWTILVYRIPAQPTRLRLQVWRKLQKMGAVYLQDAVCLLPHRPDLTENMQYIAASIEEMGGSCHLFAASAMLPGGGDELVQSFRAQADQRLREIISRLDELQAVLDGLATSKGLERFEDDLKRERVAYLRARKLGYFGSTLEAEVDARLDRLKAALDSLYREK